MGRAVTNGEGIPITNMYDTDELRKNVGSIIQALRIERDYSKAFVYKQMEIGKDTYYALEDGRAELKLENLFRLCEIYDCDINHLLGKAEYKDLELSEIYGKTGLTEEDVKVLNDAHNSDFEEDKIFLDLISKIIESYSGIHNYTFPTPDIVSYILNVRDYTAIKSNHILDATDEILRDIHKTNSQGIEFESIRELLLEQGFSEESIDSNKYGIEKLLLCGNKYLLERENRNDRLVIQEEFSRFMTSDFVEGE